MKTFIQPGDVIELTAPYDRNAGEGALIGSAFGVAVSNVTSGSKGQFQMAGVLEIKKLSTEVWTEGVKIYWDNTAKQCTLVSTSNSLIGVAAAAAANPSATGKVRLGIVA